MAQHGRDPTDDCVIHSDVEERDFASLWQRLVQRLQQVQHEDGVSPAADQHFLQYTKLQMSEIAASVQHSTAAAFGRLSNGQRLLTEPSHEQLKW